MKEDSHDDFFDNTDLENQEMDAFQRWLSEKQNRDLMEEWKKSDRLQKDLIRLRYLESRKLKNLNRFMKTINAKPETSVWKKFAVASVILVLGLGGFLISKYGIGKYDYISTDYENISLLVSPSMEYLLDSKSRNVEINGIQISLEQDRISYEKKDAIQKTVIADSLLYNELTVPNGRMCKVLLVDGTEVTLNSGSYFRYPISFEKDSIRRVYLDGEAYFKVSADKKHPFVINAPNLEARVYGTKFNIKAYSEDFYNTVMLEEGKLSIKRDRIPEEFLSPGEWVRYDLDGTCVRRYKVNASNICCWMDYKFYSEDQSLDEITCDLERKYDVNIVFDHPETAQLKFYFVTPKCEHVELVLDMLKLTHKIDYRIKGRDIYITRE